MATKDRHSSVTSYACLYVFAMSRCYQEHSLHRWLVFGFRLAVLYLILGGIRGSQLPGKRETVLSRCQAALPGLPLAVYPLLDAFPSALPMGPGLPSAVSPLPDFHSAEPMPWGSDLLLLQSTVTEL